MSNTNCYYFLRLQPPNNSTSNKLEDFQQQFSNWLQQIENALQEVPAPSHQQYDQQGIIWVWPSTLPLLKAVKAIAKISATTNTYAALDQGLGILDDKRPWCCSFVPERLPAFLQIAQQYKTPLIIGEKASTELPKTTLQYLTRSYFAGAQGALEVYGWQDEKEVL